MENRSGQATTGRTNTTQTTEARPVMAEQIIGFRIMRETEVAPSWWGKLIEIGETVSGIVADRFCTEQNKVTMDPNRVKRHRYYAEPIFARRAPDSTARVSDRQADWYTTAARALHDTHCTSCRELTAASDAFAAENGASIQRRDRQQLGLRVARTARQVNL